MNYAYKLQFTGHEEGRIRALYNNNAASNTLTGLVYDYMIKDHLGNVRMVLTDEQQNNIYPIASLEDATVSCESSYHSINTSKIKPRSEIYDPGNVLGYANNNGINAGPCGSGSGTNAKMYRLFATSSAADTGLSMTLKVMSGDVINIWGKSFYNDVNGSQVNYVTTATQLISGFLGGGMGGAAATGHGATTTVLNSNSGTVGGLNTFINDPGRGAGGTLPRAYVNWILFDEQFNYVTGGYSRTDQVANTIKDHRFTDLTMTKNGYLYIYVSNESPVAVFFDNLQVVHTRGPILEETHYYPFGLTMAGISSKAASGLENKRKFNKGSELQSKEFSDGSGLELYATNFRSLDPQLGRWWQIDPKSSESESPYASMSNNPIRYNDPLGDTIADAQIKADKNWSKAYSTFLNSKAGKRFVKLYSPGGKYGKTTVEFKIGGTGASGKTTAFAINRKDGSATKLPTDKKIDGIDKVAKGESKDSYLKFEINLREGDDMSTSAAQVDGGETILHETQHVRIDQQTLITERAMNYAFYEHRDWMKPTTSDWYKERAEFYLENRQMWKADYERQKTQGKVKDETDYIKSKVNDFFN